MSIVNYNILGSDTGYGYNPPFKSDETGFHGTPDFPISAYLADVTDNFVSWHWHEEFELGYVTEGSVLMESGNKRFTLNKGDIYFLNSNTLHALFRSCQDSKCVFRSVVANGSIIGGREDSVFYKKYILPVTSNANLREIIFTPADSNYNKILNHLKTVWNAVNIKVPDYELTVRNELSSVFRRIVKLSEADINGNTANLVQEIRLRDILNYIHAHYSEKITLDDIAAAAFISKSEVLRCFKSIIGQSPISYLKNYRLRNAAYMIQNTEYSINTISELCGFDDHSYFSKSFKEVYGCSPREYR